MAYPLKRYLLGEWELETEKRLLHRDGESVRLANKPFQVFFYLIENRDRLVSRGELLDRFWQGSDVYDASLTQCVGAIRRALHDHLDNPRFIETRWAAGYRYIGPIEIQPVEDVSSVIEVERTHAVRVLIEEEEILDAAATSEPTLVLPSRSNPASSTLRQFSRQAVPLMAACSFLALAALAAIVYRNGNSTEPVPLRSIAVMPLKNLTGDVSNEYLSDGMTDNLTSSLAKVQGLKVISRSSAFTFKGKEVDPREVGKKLGVAAVLEGSLLRGGERLRAEIRLVSTTDGRVLWASSTYDRALGDIFALQDEIARNVVAELRLGLNTQGEQQLARRYTNNVDAYHAYLKALYFSNKRTPEGLEKAFEYLHEAIARDPHYALAYAKLADTHSLGIWFTQAPPQAAMKKAKEAAERAAEIDERLAEGHLALASSYGNNWDLRNCTKELDRALELDPGSAEVRHHYAYSLLLAGRPEEAVTEIKRALELDPLSVPMNVDVGEILLYSRRYDEAIEALRKALEMDRHRPNVHHDLAEAYEQKGMEREAVAEYIEEDAVAGENQQTIAALKEAYTGSGMRGFWQRKLDSFKEKSKHSYFPPFVIAEIYARLGEKDRAFLWLEKAYAEQSPMILNLKTRAALDPLRSDRRFADLVHRVGLPG